MLRRGSLPVPTMRPYQATPAFSFGLCAAYSQVDASAPAEAGDAERAMSPPLATGPGDAGVEVGHHLRVGHLGDDVADDLWMLASLRGSPWRAKSSGAIAR
jgi:hypothetical protein